MARQPPARIITHAKMVPFQRARPPQFTFPHASAQNAIVVFRTIVIPTAVIVGCLSRTMALQSPISEKKLDGKVALVTGASKGLGKAMAMTLGAAGASIVLVSRNIEQLNVVGGAIKDAGGKARAFQADVSEEEQVRKLERDVIGAFGKVQILVNNAGINVRKPLVELTLEEWHRVLNTNLTSVFLMCRSF